MQSAELDKSAVTVRRMFEGVAPRYDLLNHLLSASLDRHWRLRAAAELAADSGEPILDLCCGTGDQAASLSSAGRRVIAADFCLPMLALARRKLDRLGDGSPSTLAADALQLPFADDAFAAVTISFGVRNLADLDAGLRQSAAILRPGGRLVVLEFALPTLPVVRQLYLAYLRFVLPAIGRLLSPHGSAYGYLRDSVMVFPQRQAFVDHLLGCGFAEASFRDLSGGTLCLYTARKAAVDDGSVEIPAVEPTS